MTTASHNGVITTETAPGTYAVASNCTGKGTWDFATMKAKFSFVVTSTGFLLAAQFPGATQGGSGVKHGSPTCNHLGIMFGFDQDDVGIFRRTADFLDESAVDVATVSMVVPMPGTPTFHRMNADGRILTTDSSKYDGKRHCVFEPARMSPKALEAGTEWVARRFYSPSSIARRLKLARRHLVESSQKSGLHAGEPSNAGPSWDESEQV